jgi:hypothetical protein
MKTILPLLLACWLPLSGWCEFPPLRKGDDASRIIEVLGEPNGFMETELQGIYYYDRGEIRTRHGKVTFVYLISEEEFAKQQAQAEQDRLQRIEEGNRRFVEIMNQGGLDGLSGKAQVNYWDAFRTQYPEVDISIPYLQARKRAEQEIAREAEAARLARLEQRVLEAELRAARAQEQAARAQQTAATTRTRTRVVTGSSWYVPRGYYVRKCPKTNPGRPTPYQQRQNIQPQIQTSLGLTGDTTLISHQIP